MLCHTVAFRNHLQSSQWQHKGSTTGAQSCMCESDMASLYNSCGNNAINLYHHDLCSALSVHGRRTVLYV